ncbi:unnamed protein product [Cuscuta epithymum]|uniref:Thaumatin-like protein n=1 Tax=Cuscuta epithymum TaxID=186058 RepID=A0AAV0G5D4_9ASTE|nr:unnamed protein product [Cuscuta epithymum]
MAKFLRPFSPILSFCFISLFSPVFPTTFTIVNECSDTIWPGILSNAGAPMPETTGFSLGNGQSRAIALPAGWSGRLWGRTGCSPDATTGRFTCDSGDCDSVAEECNGNGAQPPATLAEFTLNGSDGLDFFDVSLVDGYNLPMLVAPTGGAQGHPNCTEIGCAVDMDRVCPAELRLLDGRRKVVGCKSACFAFGTPEYCCSGSYATPDTCRPSNYAVNFKSACPRAYSYAYDDSTSTFTCASADYVITFCPTSSPATSQRTSGGHPTSPSSGGGVSAIGFYHQQIFALFITITILALPAFESMWLP